MTKNTASGVSCYVWQIGRFDVKTQIHSVEKYFKPQKQINFMIVTEECWLQELEFNIF